MSRLSDKFMTDGLDMPSEIVEVELGGEVVKVKVQALPKAEVDAIDGHDGEGADHDGYNIQDEFILKCCRDPKDDSLIFTEQDAADFAKRPAVTDSWYATLVHAIDYVHGLRTDPPDGVDEPMIEEIQEAAAQGEQILKNCDEDQISPSLGNDLLEVFKQIRLHAGDVERHLEGLPSGDEGNDQAHSKAS